MKALSAFTPELVGDVPQCPDPVIELHLVRVARDFCTRTSVWRDAFPAITYAADTLSYFLATSESNTQLVRPLSLRVGDLLWWSEKEARDNEELARWPVEQPPFSIDIDGEQITLTVQPDGDIVVEGCMRPTPTATQLPDFLANDYVEAMRSGTLARLLAMAGKPWTNAPLAVFHAGEYARQLNFAANKAASGNTRKPLRTRKWG